MKYIGNEIQRPGDLTPRGIRSTYQTEKLSFNVNLSKTMGTSKHETLVPYCEGSILLKDIPNTR
jgi:hypothetical protein